MLSLCDIGVGLEALYSLPILMCLASRWSTLRGSGSSLSRRVEQPSLHSRARLIVCVFSLLLPGFFGLFVELEVSTLLPILMCVSLQGPSSSLFVTLGRAAHCTLTPDLLCVSSRSSFQASSASCLHETRRCVSPRMSSAASPYEIFVGGTMLTGWRERMSESL